MRDILPDLRERLERAEGQRAQMRAAYDSELLRLQKEFKQSTAILDSEVSAIQALLDIEVRRAGGPVSSAPKPTLPIQDFLVKAVDEGVSLGKEQLRDLADQAGYFGNGESPGRVTHAQLVNLVRSGRLLWKDNKYTVPPKTAGEKEGGPASTGHTFQTALGLVSAG